MKFCIEKRVVVEAVFPSLDQARELVSQLAMDLDLKVTLLRGRVARAQTRLKLELRGEPKELADGVRRIELGEGFVRRGCVLLHEMPEVIPNG